MKRNFFIAVLFMMPFLSFSQPWLNKLPMTKSNKELTLKDYQKAFNDFWTPYHVVKGKYTNSKGKLQKATGWKQFKRWEWYMESQVDPKTGAFPKTSAMDEFQKFQNRNKALKADYTWTNLGTNSSTGGYAGIGRLNCIAFHPDDTATFWVGAPSGGLWKTTDGGSSWTCLTDNLGVMGVSSIIIPSDYATSNTIYIGTGDRDAYDNRSIGILKSTDGGISWNATGFSYQIHQGLYITKMILDPNNNEHIIVISNAGVRETTDGGATFTKINQDTDLWKYIDLEYKPDDFTRLYASYRSAGRIDYSTDGGITWSEAITIKDAERIELAVSPAQPTWVYAIVADSEGGLNGIYKSTDSGETYTEVYSGTTKNLLGWSDKGSDDGGQGWYDLSIAVSPINAEVILVGGINTWKSTDGGVTWSIANHWYNNTIQAVHADKHNLDFRSNGDLFEVNDGGIYISPFPNDGDKGSWVDITNGITISQIYKLSCSQLSEKEVITGLQDNGSKLYTNDQWWDVKGGDGMECLIDYTDDNVQYATYVNGQISRTLDHWNQDYKDIEPTDGSGNSIEGAWVTPFIIHPDDNQTIYAGYSDVYKTLNRGNVWKKTSVINTDEYIRSMAICEYAASNIYIASLSNLWKSINGGLSWVSKAANLPTGGNILSIAVKADDPNIVWITLGGYQHDGVYQSNDGGTTWSSISAGLPQIPIHTIVYNKLEKSTIELYAGTEVGVYYKSGNNDWVYYNNGLPNVIVSELEIFYNQTNPEQSKLRAATYGRGLWEAPLVTNNAYAPSVSTISVTDITETSAKFNASVDLDYGSSVIESGFVYSPSKFPFIGETSSIALKTEPNVNQGNYSINVEGLIANTTYYVRSYAVNANGTSYGKAKTFNTLKPTSIEQLVKYGIQIFPNPTQGDLSIRFNELTGSVMINVKDISGKTIISQKAERKLTIIPLKGQASGIYFVELVMPSKTIVTKVVLDK